MTHVQILLYVHTKKPTSSPLHYFSSFLAILCLSLVDHSSLLSEALKYAPQAGPVQASHHRILCEAPIYGQQDPRRTSRRGLEQDFLRIIQGRPNGHVALRGRREALTLLAAALALPIVLTGPSDRTGPAL
jgi:hypothetical protein